MKTGSSLVATGYAFLAAALYALNTPLSKFFLAEVSATYMAGFLYLGAGIGVGILYLFAFRREPKTVRLVARDFPYVVGMIVLDILAPIFLMWGLRSGSASGAALLGNFEIVTTTLIALLLFRERVTGRLWTAVGCITAASILLSLEAGEKIAFSGGSLLVLLAALCWGLENNCTRRISERSTYQIVTLKGIFSGFGSVCVAAIRREPFPPSEKLPWVLLLGFVAYGCSIFCYIRAQRILGAAKTSAYYAVAPFIGAGLSFLLYHEALTKQYVLALLCMAVGTALVAADTLKTADSGKV